MGLIIRRNLSGRDDINVERNNYYSYPIVDRKTFSKKKKKQYIHFLKLFFLYFSLKTATQFVT